jgi:hypothetical protein
MKPDGTVVALAFMRDNSSSSSNREQTWLARGLPRNKYVDPDWEGDKGVRAGVKEQQFCRFDEQQVA